MEAPLNDFNYEVRFDQVSSFLNEYAENISKGGIFLKTATPPQLDQSVSIKLYLPNHSEAINLKGIVVRRITQAQAQKSSCSPGMGLRFVQFDEAVESFFFNYLKELN